MPQRGPAIRQTSVAWAEKCLSAAIEPRLEEYHGARASPTGGSNSRSEAELHGARCGRLKSRRGRGCAPRAQVIGAQHAGSMTIASTQSSAQTLHGRNSSTACTIQPNLGGRAPRRTPPAWSGWLWGWPPASRSRPCPRRGSRRPTSTPRSARISAARDAALDRLRRPCGTRPGLGLVAPVRRRAARAVVHAAPGSQLPARRIPRLSARLRSSDPPTTPPATA